MIDMGGPCTKGSFSDLDNFSDYATYYVASDLPNGGYTDGPLDIRRSIRRNQSGEAVSQSGSQPTKAWRMH